MRAALLVIFAISATACKETAPMPKLVPVTQAQAEAIAPKLEAAMQGCTPDLESLIDRETMFRIGMAGHNVRPDVVDGLIAGSKQANTTRDLFCAKLPRGYDYKLVHVHTSPTDGAPHLLYRVIYGGGGFDYHDVRLATSADNATPRVVDIYIYTRGQNASEGFANLVDGMLDHDVDSQDRVKVTLREAQTAAARGDHKTAADKFALLPPEIRATKPVQLEELQNEKPVDRQAYFAMLERFKAAFPTDPALDMILIDYDILHKDFPGALAAVDRVDARVGGDPFLESVRANLDVDAGKPADAVRHATAATTKAPTLHAAWSALVDAENAAGDIPGTVAAMRELQTRFNVVFRRAKLAQLPAYAALLASPDYKAYEATF